MIYVILTKMKCYVINWNMHSHHKDDIIVLS